MKSNKAFGLIAMLFVSCVCAQSGTQAKMQVAPRAVKLRDPTTPPGFVQAEEDATIGESEINLNGIFITGKKRSALINGVFAQVGDKVGSYKVIRIDQHQVLVSGDSGIITLTLTPELIKTPVSEQRNEE